jgi:hypothetical protein
MEIKWPFWEDFSFLRTSFESSDDNEKQVWTSEEAGKSKFGH